MANTVVQVPQGDFVTSTLNGAITAAATSMTIGAGLNLDANGGYLQIDYDSSTAYGSDNGPETVSYTSYNSGTGAVTGISRGLAGLNGTGVAHANGAKVQCGPSSLYIKDGNTLGYAQATSNQTGITTEVDLTSLTTTVTVPAGGRRIKITGYAEVSNTGTAGRTTMYIKEGATKLQQFSVLNAVASSGAGLNCVYSVAPAVGSHTYKLSMESTSGTSNTSQTANNPAFILVELI